MRPHGIKLGQVVTPADTYSFEYVAKPGAYAGGATLTFPLPGNEAAAKSRVASINAMLAKPQTLDIVIDTNRGEQTLKIQRLYPHSPRFRQDRSNLLYTVDVSDLRWKWTGQPVTGHFNLVRRINDIQSAENGQTPQVPGQARIVDGEVVTPTVQAGVAPLSPEIDSEGRIVNFRPKDVLSKHATYPAVSYRRATLDWNDDSFSGPVSESQAKPWTALRLIQGILRGYWAYGSKGMVQVPGLLEAGEWGGFRDDLEDNDFVVSRLSYYMTPAQEVLSQLMRWAECRLVAWIDGKVYLHPTYSDTPPQVPDTATAEGTGVIFMSDNTADRPSAIRVGFRNELTKRFKYEESADSAAAGTGTSVAVGDRPEKAPATIEPKLLNVIQLPRNEQLDLGEGPQEYQRGEYQPLDKVLEAWGITGGTEYIRQRIYKFFEGAVAAEVYGQSTGSPLGVDEEIQRRIAAIKQAYRKLFRIDPRYLDIMMDLRAESVVQIDPISGRRGLAPMWVDYSLLRRNRVEQAKVKDETLRFQDVEYDKGEDGIAPAAGVSPSPFIPNVLDPQLGVFTYEAVSELGVQEIYPWLVEDDDGRPFSLGRNVINANLTNASPAGDYVFATDLVVSECDPNSGKQMTTVEIPNEAIGAKPGAHPPYYVFDASETARYDVDGNLINEVLLKARAQSIARTIQGTFQDRPIGITSWAGLYEVYPSSTAKSVSWRLEPSGVVMTTLDMSEPPPKRDEDVVLKDPDLRRARQRLPEAP